MSNYNIPKSTLNKILQHQESLLNIVDSQASLKVQKKQIVDVISAQAVLKGLSEQRAFFQSLDDCNDQDLNALRWLESRALKQRKVNCTKATPNFKFL